MPPATATTRYARRAILTLVFAAFLSCLAPGKAEALSLCGILCSCTVSAGTLTLSDYTTITPTIPTGTGTVTVGCQLLGGLISLIVPYSIGISRGGGPSVSQRRLSGPSSSTLNYNLYSDALFGSVWEDIGSLNLVSSAITVITVGLSVLNPHTVYARIPSGQNVRAGPYTDTVTVTLSF